VVVALQNFAKGTATENRADFIAICNLIADVDFIAMGGGVKSVVVRIGAGRGGFDGWITNIINGRIGEDLSLFVGIEKGRILRACNGGGDWRIADGRA
jgi:hypothetical protein